MKTVLPLLCIFGLLGWCLWGCENSKSYPDIPEISFEKLIVKDKLDSLLGNITKKADLTLYFIDGDGDIGKYPYSTSMLSQVFVTWQKKLADGTYETYTFADGSTTQKYDIPYDDRMNRDEAQNKTLRGTIEVSLDAPSGDLGDMDIVRLEFYITDRAQHASNVDYTPDFSILDETVHIE